MKRKFLEDLGLERDVIDKIMDENGRDIEAAKGDLSTITAERDSLKTQATDYNKQIEALKASAGDNEALKQQIAELQAQNKSTRINSAVDMALTLAKAKNVKAVKALLEGLDKAEFGDDGKVKGLDDQIKKLQGADDTKFLFAEEVKPKGMQPKGATPEACEQSEDHRHGANVSLRYRNCNNGFLNANWNYGSRTLSKFIDIFMTSPNQYR